MSDRDKESAARDLYHSEDPVIFVSQNFVIHFKKKTGDLIDMQTPTGQVKMRIVGVVVDWASPVGAVSMSREQYKKYWKDPLLNSFNVYVQPGQDANLVR